MKAPRPATRATGEFLGQGLKAAPRVAFPADARGRYADWAKALPNNADGRRLAAYLESHATATDLLRRLADGSPYLWELATASPKRLIGLLGSDPDRHLAAILRRTSGAADTTDDESELAAILRRMKADAALLIALADIGGVWEVMRVTRALTDVADVAVGATVRFLLRRAASEGRLELPDARDLEQGCGYVVLAMGKMGAGELNYSSDIDLIVLFDPTVQPAAEPTTFVRITQHLVRLLQQRTSDGYVFRTDLRLRPDPASTAIAISVQAALDYYENAGQNWERAALIKARPCAGDMRLGERFLSQVAPFVWRKYLDYVALRDVHAMKRDIHVYKGHGDIAVEGHNIKLGRGGIREIEFFVQTQQLIAGGRHPELRSRETLTTLRALADGGWIAAPARDELDAAYRFLRTVEHRLQMVADDQTHTLPERPDAMAAFARFLGFKSRDAFSEILLKHLRIVQQHYARLFEAGAAGQEQQWLFPPDRDERETLDRLSERGFREPLAASAVIRRWLSGELRTTRSETARQALSELLPQLIDSLTASENPNAALTAFDHFIGGVRNGARFFSLLRQNPDLLSLIALLLGSAPRLAGILAQRPQVIDPLIEPSFFGSLPGLAELDAILARSLRQASGDEDLLDRVRLFGQEQMFLIGVRTLSNTISAAQAGGAFADLADVVIRVLHRWVAEHMVRSYGRIRGDSAVLAMGKLGGREMNAASDLDLIVVYDFDSEYPESDGRRPMAAQPYFARLTQRLINALTAQTNLGRLYDVDLRLRPSGRSGPVATSIAAFESYQRDEAWTWEHLALTRARVVSGPPALAARIERVIQSVLCARRDAVAVAADVRDMRRAIDTERGGTDHWNLKDAAGGLIDVEFVAQYLQLAHAADHPDILSPSTALALEKATRLGLLARDDADVLRTAVKFYHDLTQILRLCVVGPFDPDKAGPGLLQLLAGVGDAPDFSALDAELKQTLAAVKAAAERVLAQAG